MRAVRADEEDIGDNKRENQSECEHDTRHEGTRDQPPSPSVGRPSCTRRGSSEAAYNAQELIGAVLQALGDERASALGGVFVLPTGC